MEQQATIGSKTVFDSVDDLYSTRTPGYKKSLPANFS